MTESTKLQIFGDNIHVGVLCTKYDKHFTIDYANESFYQIIGYKKKELFEQIENKFASLIHPEDVIAAVFEYLEHSSTFREYKIEMRIRKKDGSYLWCEFSGNTVLDKNGENHAYAVVTDISEKKNAMSDNVLANLTGRCMDLDKNIDLLTGCFNKDTAEETIKSILKNSIETDAHVLMIVDIDNFADINKNLSYAFGDKVLGDIGNHLKKINRNGDVVGRISGNKFIFFFRNMYSFIAIKQKVEEVAFVFRLNITSQSISHKMSSSIGVSLFKENNNTYENLYYQAHSAMRLAKNKGKDQYRISNESIHAKPIKKESKTENSNGVTKHDKSKILLVAFKILQTAHHVPTAINEVIGLVGKEYNVSRVFIFERAIEGEYFSNTYEWCAEGTEPQKDKLQNIPIEDYAYMTSFAREDGIFACNDINEIYGNYYELLLSQGVKSFVQGYVKINNVPQMLVGFDECTSAREWTDDEIISVIYLSNLLSAFSGRLESADFSKKLNRFKNLSEIDQLTGLASKEKFYLNTKELLELNTDKKFYFFLMNINKFQTINSFFGMEEGDNLLKAMAYYLNEHGKQTLYSCGRMGADIFCGCQELTEPIDIVLENMLEKVKNTIENYRSDYNLSISIGVFVIDDINTPMEVMYSKAMMAAKKVKHIKNTSYSIYHADMEADEIREQSIINDMYPALIENQFEVYLQPKVALSNEEVVGAEALVRWNHPTKGCIPPADFIPIFEKNGLVSKIDYFVWETVFAFLRMQKDNNVNLIPISVNISRVDLFNKNLVECFEKFLTKYDVDPYYLHIEITESAYTENYAEIIKVINRLKEIGFHIEMDDFGTGYSSLNMFSEMVVDTIKLDMNFIKNLQQSGDKHNILSFIISLAKHFDLPVVAEGIETGEQLKFLRDIGCDIGQGYYFAKPMPMDQFLIYLAEKQNKTVLVESEKAVQLIDINDILYPDPKWNYFFNNVLSATGIFEVVGESIKLIRSNEEYYKIFEVIGHKRLFRANITDSFYQEDLKPLFLLIEKAKASQKTTSFDIRVVNFSRKDKSEKEQFKYIHMCFKLIYSNSESDMYISTFEELPRE